MSSSFFRRLRRVGQILAFARGARYPWDAWRLAVLGVARGHPLNCADLPSRILYRRYPRVVVRPATLRGLRVVLDPADISHAMIFEEIYVERVYDLSAVKFRPAAVIDCGAHIGLFTLLAAATYPDSKILSFEPNPQNAAMLRRQIELNGLQQIEFVEAAVSIADSLAWFSAEGSFGGSLRDSVEAVPGAYQVQVVDLPRLMRERAPKSLLLKIDIEGEEQRLVPRILPFLPPACAIFIETHQGTEGWRTIERLLLAAGFCLHLTRDRGQWVDGWAIRR